MRHIVIGDVHGCLSELRALIAKVDLQPDDIVVFVGDLVMKGPDQSGVVQYARELSYCNETILVRGNHEDRLLCFLQAKAQRPSKAYAMKNSVALDKVSSSLSPEDVVFLYDSSFFYRFISGDREFIVVHAGITPKMEHAQFFSRPKKSSDRRRLKQLCHVRYVTEEGGIDAFAKEGNSRNFWAESYDGRFGYAVYGHMTYIDVVEHDHAIGVDLGCVYGNKLAALVIEDGKQHIVTVGAEKVYYSEGSKLS